MAKEHPLKKEKEEKSSKPPKDSPPLTEAERIEEWRRQEFTKLLPSVNYDVITELVKGDADLGRARGLKDKGCPPDLIARILAPV
jgi:hypothetical protein